VLRFVLEASRHPAPWDLGGVLASATAIFRRYPEGANRARDSVKTGKAMTKARKRKRVHRVARGKPKAGHIVAPNRRCRKGEILCHNHVVHTAATANGVHGFR
jgi:hypothetical protein